MIHVFLKLVENHCKRHGNLIVEKKKRAKRTKPKKPTKSSEVGLVDLSEEQLGEIWECFSSDISSAIRGQIELPSDIIPFDAASDIPIDEQRY